MILFLLVLFFVQRIKVQQNLARFGDVNLLQSLSEENSKKKHYFKFFLVVLSLIFVVFSLANPLLGTKLTEGKRQGVDVVILLDVSNSMKAEDVKPNRLERAKQMIMKLIDNLVNDRIGIIVFAGEPYVQLPLTTDYSAAKLFTSYVDTDIIPTQGTAIGAA
ncbi:MAG: VWA domain-containing protein, partial [Candidatus Kapaibacteriota bacterium]